MLIRNSKHSLFLVALFMSISLFLSAQERFEIDSSNLGFLNKNTEVFSNDHFIELIDDNAIFYCLLETSNTTDSLLQLIYSSNKYWLIQITGIQNELTDWQEETDLVDWKEQRVIKRTQIDAIMAHKINNLFYSSLSSLSKSIISSRRDGIYYHIMSSSGNNKRFGVTWSPILDSKMYSYIYLIEMLKKLCTNHASESDIIAYIKSIE